jgi:hypothetical protein
MSLAEWWLSKQRGPVPTSNRSDRRWNGRYFEGEAVRRERHSSRE